MSFVSFRLACSLAAAASVCAPALAQHRCESQGRVQYQQTPCESVAPVRPQATPAAVWQPKPNAPRPSIGDPDYEARRSKERAQEIDDYAKRAGASIAAAAAGRTAQCGRRGPAPFIGATGAWIRACSDWGAPDQVHSLEHRAGKSYQWMYRHRGTLHLDSAEQVTMIQQ